MIPSTLSPVEYESNFKAISPSNSQEWINNTPCTSNLSKGAMFLTCLDIEELWDRCSRIQESTRIAHIRRDQKLLTLQFRADPSTGRTMSSKDLVVKTVAHHLLQTKVVTWRRFIWWHLPPLDAQVTAESICSPIIGNSLDPTSHEVNI